jgi:hypothetical protein
MLRNLCAHRLEVAMATASPRFMVPCLGATEPLASAAAETATPASAGLRNESLSCGSMDKAMKGRPHPNIRSEGRRNYLLERQKANKKKKGAEEIGRPFLTSPPSPGQT